jgi:hypothetical protein
MPTMLFCHGSYWCWSLSTESSEVMTSNLASKHNTLSLSTLLCRRRHHASEVQQLFSTRSLSDVSWGKVCSLTEWYAIPQVSLDVDMVKCLYLNPLEFLKDLLYFNIQVLAIMLWKNLKFIDAKFESGVKKFEIHWCEIWIRWEKPYAQNFCCQL